MPAQYWVAPLSQPSSLGSAGAALANSITLTDITAVPQATLVAGQLYAGAVIRVTAYGVFSTTVTPTLLIGTYYGATALGTTGAITTGSGVANVPWRIETLTFVRAIGTAAASITQGFCAFGTTVAATSFLPIPNTALATVNIDTTTAQTISVKAQWGTASASNTITCHGGLVELIG